VPTERMPNWSKIGCKIDPLLPVPPLLIVVITGITSPIPRASTNVPINTKIIKTGIASRDSRGKSVHSLPKVPGLSELLDVLDVLGVLGVLRGEFIWL
jgi:hypothetical protein